MIKTSDCLLRSIKVKYLCSNLSQSIVRPASCSVQPPLYVLGLYVKYGSFNDSVTSLTKYKLLCGSTINRLVVRNDSAFNGYPSGFVPLQDTRCFVCTNKQRYFGIRNFSSSPQLLVDYLFYTYNPNKLLLLIYVLLL